MMVEKINNRFAVARDIWTYRVRVILSPIDRQAGST